MIYKYLGSLRSESYYIFDVVKYFLRREDLWLNALNF